MSLDLLRDLRRRLLLPLRELWAGFEAVYIEGWDRAEQESAKRLRLEDEATAERVKVGQLGQERDGLALELQALGAELARWKAAHADASARADGLAARVTQLAAEGAGLMVRAKKARGCLEFRGHGHERSCVDLRCSYCFAYEYLSGTRDPVSGKLLSQEPGCAK